MPNVRDFLMPDLGEGLTEGEVIEWLVAEGDTVAVDQPVAEISTEKAVVQVPTPFAGRVITLHGTPGDMIKVGTPLISIEVSSETSDATARARRMPRPRGGGVWFRAMRPRRRRRRPRLLQRPRRPLRRSCAVSPRSWAST